MDLRILLRYQLNYYLAEWKSYSYFYIFNKLLKNMSTDKECVGWWTPKHCADELWDAHSPKLLEVEGKIRNYSSWHKNPDYIFKSLNWNINWSDLAGSDSSGRTKIEHWNSSWLPRTISASSCTGAFVLVLVRDSSPRTISSSW